MDTENQVASCSHLKEEILHPLRVIITNWGPDDTELLLANPSDYLMHDACNFKKEDAATRGLGGCAEIVSSRML